MTRTEAKRVEVAVDPTSRTPSSSASKDVAEDTRPADEEEEEEKEKDGNDDGDGDGNGRGGQKKGEKENRRRHRHRHRHNRPPPPSPSPPPGGSSHLDPDVSEYQFYQSFQAIQQIA